MSLQTAYEAFQKGDYDTAEGLLRRPLDAGEPKAFHLAAMLFGKLNDPGRARSAIERGLELSPKDAEMHNQHGLILARLNDPVGAQAAYRRALEIDPDYHQARHNFGFLALDTAQPDLAVDLFSDLVKTQDNPAYPLALVYALQGAERHEEALAWLDGRESRMSGPGRGGAEREALRGKILFALGHYDDSVAANARAIDSERFGAQALGLSAQALRMLGQWDAAKALLRATIDAHPGRADLRATAARAFHAAGETETARVLLRDGSGPDVQAALARILLDEGGDAAMAVELMNAALTGRPGDLTLMKAYCEAALAAGQPQTAQVIAQLGEQRVPLDQFFVATRVTAGRMRGQDYGYYYDYDKYVRAYDLAPPEGWSDMANFNADLKRSLESLHGFRHAPLDQSLRLGTQTSPDLRFVDDPVIQAFFRAVQPAIDRYLAHIGSDGTHPFTRRNTGAARVAAAWSVRLGQGGHHVNHIHPEGWISSSYYVDVPAEVSDKTAQAGWITFGQPPASIAGPNPELTPEMQMQPRPGRLVLFPSYMWHGTTPLTGNATRLTLPFDLLPA